MEKHIINILKKPAYEGNRRIEVVNFNIKKGSSIMGCCSMRVDDLPFKVIDEVYLNLTVGFVLEDDGALKKVADNYGFDNTDDFEISDSFSDFLQDYNPVGNTLWLLEKTPTVENAKILYENATSIIILRDEFGNSYITLRESGADYSDSIAYAFMVIDGYIHQDLIKGLETLTLSTDLAKDELLKFIELHHKGSK